MMIFTNVRCASKRRILATGFDDALDSGLAHHYGHDGLSGVYCTEEPLDDADLPADYHLVFALDVPEDVLNSYELVVENRSTPEGSARIGWLLPAPLANEYRNDCTDLNGFVFDLGEFPRRAEIEEACDGSQFAVIRDALCELDRKREARWAADAIIRPLHPPDHGPNAWPPGI